MRKSEVITIVAVLGMALHGNAEARVFRCTDAQGKVSYSQTPCPANQQSDQMRGVEGGPRQSSDLCLLARDFAELVFTDIKQGVEPNTVIEEHGGVNYINPPTLGVINFAAGLRYNTQLTPQRVGSMAFSRCREGGFGKLQPGDLPEPEVDETAELRGSAQSGMHRGPAPVPSSRQIATDGGNAEGACDAYRERLADLNEQLRNKSSARENDALSIERARYRDLLAAECEH